MVLFYIVYLRDHTREIICSSTSAHAPKIFERQYILLYYTFMHLFYKAGVVLNYIEAFIAVSAQSHNITVADQGQGLISKMRLKF